MVSEKTIRLSLVVVAMSVMFSCSITTHKNFTAYQETPTTESSAKPKINGIFFRKPYEKFEHSPPIYFYLLSDGSLIQVNGEGTSRIAENKFWDSPEYYLENLRLAKFGTLGHYFIRDSIITLQFYDVNPGAIVSYNTLELVGRIKNDTTVSLEKGNCKWCASSWLEYNSDGTITFNDLEYVLYKTDIFPDTIDMWFKRKRWYKRKVWNAGSLQRL